ncbi:MAG: DUF4339 domain-containing protein [Cyclobacteriaceae bacterium]
MNDQWYYVADGKEIGPIGISELAYTIKPETLVWKEGMEKWTKAGYIRELKPIFHKSPPPVPHGEKEEGSGDRLLLSQKAFDRINNSTTYCVTYAILIIVSGGMEFFDTTSLRLHHIILLVAETNFIRILLSLKSYLTEVVKYDGANLNLNWIIYASIPTLFAILLMERKYSEDYDGNEPLYYILGIVCLVGLIILFYHWIALIRKLIKVKHSSFSHFKTFAYLELISLLVTFIALMFFDEGSLTIFTDTVFSIIPVFFLYLGFNHLKKDYFLVAP